MTDVLDYDPFAAQPDKKSDAAAAAPKSDTGILDYDPFTAQPKKPQPEKPGFFSGLGSAILSGGIEPAQNLAQLPGALSKTNKVEAQPDPATQPEYDKPLDLAQDWHDPGLMAQKMAKGLASMAPNIIVGEAGALGATALATAILGSNPVGWTAMAIAAAGMGAAAGLEAGVEKLGPLYQKYLAETKDPDKAFNSALGAAEKEGALNAATMGVFKFAPAQLLAKNALMGKVAAGAADATENTTAEAAASALRKADAKDLALQVGAIQPGIAVADQYIEAPDNQKPTAGQMLNTAATAALGIAAPIGLSHLVGKGYNALKNRDVPPTPRPVYEQPGLTTAWDEGTKTFAVVNGSGQLVSRGYTDLQSAREAAGAPIPVPSVEGAKPFKDFSSETPAAEAPAQEVAPDGQIVPKPPGETLPPADDALHEKYVDALEDLQLRQQADPENIGIGLTPEQKQMFEGHAFDDERIEQIQERRAAQDAAPEQLANVADTVLSGEARGSAITDLVDNAIAGAEEPVKKATRAEEPPPPPPPPGERVNAFMDDGTPLGQGSRVDVEGVPHVHFDGESEPVPAKGLKLKPVEAAPVAEGVVETPKKKGSRKAPKGEPAPEPIEPKPEPIPETPVIEAAETGEKPVAEEPAPLAAEPVGEPGEPVKFVTGEGPNQETHTAGPDGVTRQFLDPKGKPQTEFLGADGRWKEAGDKAAPWKGDAESGALLAKIDGFRNEARDNLDGDHINRLLDLRDDIVHGDITKEEAASRAQELMHDWKPGDGVKAPPVADAGRASYVDGTKHVAIVEKQGDRANIRIHEKLSDGSVGPVVHEYDAPYKNANANAARAMKKINPANTKFSLADIDLRRGRNPDAIPEGDWARIEKGLADQLKKAGLGDDVAVKLVREIEGGTANGQYLNKLITMATDFVRTDKNGTHIEPEFFHEMIHAMKALDLIPERMWAALEAKAKGEWANKYADLKAQYEEKYAGRANRDAAVTEELIAKAASDFRAGQMKGYSKTLIGKAFDHITDFLRGVKDWATGNKLKSSDDIFRAIQSGRAAREARAAEPSGRQSEQPAYSLREKKPGRDGLYNPLPIPEDHEVKLNRAISRKPDVGAPKNGAVRLPNGMHVGKVNFQQWKSRVEKLLSPEEISQARRWYTDALPLYEAYFGKEKAPAMLGAWLTANVNATPSFAQLSASRTLEQYINRTGEFGKQKQGGLAHEKLMNYWDAILSGDLSKLDRAGSGQKIYDFIDSALQKDTRTFYGEDPRAGMPAVADVHSLRDMGFVDKATLNWVEQNFGPKVAEKVAMDSEGLSPSESQYEWSANKMRQFTDALNKQNYMGGRWTPQELQAVGWSAMSKMLGRKAETPEGAITSNIRNLSYEFDPGEGAPFLSRHPEWNGLTPDQKTEVSKVILPKIIDEAKKIAGATEFARIFGLGGWKDMTNPAYKSRLIASPEVARDVANIIGYLAEQTEVFGYRVEPNGKSLGLAIYGDLRDPEKVAKVWERVAERHPDLAVGFSPSIDANGVHGMEMLFNSGGSKLEARIAKELIPTIDSVSKELGISVQAKTFRASTEGAHNDWTKDPTGGMYLSGLSERYGPDISGRLELFKRKELEPAISSAIDKAGRSEPLYSLREGREDSTRPEELPGRGELPRGDRQLEASDREAPAPLKGAPTRVKIPGLGAIEVGPNKDIRDAAHDYVRGTGRQYDPPVKYARVDPERAARIADAYEAMEHAPNDPKVKAAYAALAKETMAQWEAIKKTGFKPEFFDYKDGDPYEASPRLATEDINNNNHMWVYPTDAGYGERPITDHDMAENPMLAQSGETISGKPARINDIFRIVHDYFGHAKEGVGFRADGEENAWRQHSAMFSPEAQRALTTETRGQNSWVNYGPHGEKNRTASGADTIFADQKVGLLPEWISKDGVHDDEGMYSLRKGRSAPTEITKEMKDELGAQLKKYGLEHVKLGFIDRIREHTANGRYEPLSDMGRLITLASDNPGGLAGMKKTLNHEVVHVLDDIGLWTKNERAAVLKEAMKTADPKLMKEYKDIYQKGRVGGKELLARIESEVMAHYLPDAMQNRPEGLLGNAIQKVKDFFEAIRNWNLGGETVSGVIEKLESGELGRRPKKLNQFGAEPLYSARHLREEEKPVFFSALERGIENSPLKTGQLSQWLGTLRNMPGIKGDEIHWSGLKDYFTGHKGPITKDELLDFVKRNGVKIEETLKGPKAEQKVPKPDSTTARTVDGEAEEFMKKNAVEDNYDQVHMFDLPDQMAEDVSEGQPLFSLRDKDTSKADEHLSALQHLLETKDPDGRGPLRKPVQMAQAVGDALMNSTVAKLGRRIIGPGAFDKTALIGAQNIRQFLGKAAHLDQIARHAFEDTVRELRGMPEEFHDKFANAVDTGNYSGLDPKWQQVAHELKAMTREATVRLQSVGKLENAKENYLGRIWKLPDEQASDSDKAQRTVLSRLLKKQPLTGPGTFLRARHYDTYAEARQADLVPVYPDPITTQLVKLAEMNKYYAGTLIADVAKKGNKDYPPMAREYKAGEPKPEGFMELEGPEFQKSPMVFVGPEKVAITKTMDKATKVEKFTVYEKETGDPVKDFDTREAAEAYIKKEYPPYKAPGSSWYAPEGFARVYNNFQSKGIEATPFADTTSMIRKFGNAMNGLQLSLSMFHPVFTSLDAQISRVGLGIDQAMRGQFGLAAKNITMGAIPLANWIPNLREGDKLYNAYLDPTKATPDQKLLIDALTRAGGRVTMDTILRPTAQGPWIKNARELAQPVTQFAQAWKEAGVLHPGLSGAMGRVFNIVGRTLEVVNAPTMEYLVPRQKMGVFARYAEDWMANHPKATEVEKTIAFQDIWDSVDNRLGQMVYDNLFWTKTLKDLSFLTVRSVGWNMGSIREIGGGLTDVGKNTLKLVGGQEAEWTRRMSYLVALPMVTGIYGAMYQYLATGKGPDTEKYGMMDFFFPRTGLLREIKMPSENGKTIVKRVPDRINIPSYIKDVFAWRDDPTGTATNKLHPLWSTMAQAWSNHDFFGDPIRNPEDPAVAQLADFADWMAKTQLPFSIQSTQKLYQTRPGAQAALGFFGLAPAPNAIVAPDQKIAWEQQKLEQELKRREKRRKAASKVKPLQRAPEED